MHTPFDPRNVSDKDRYDLAMKVGSKSQADSQFAMLLQRQIEDGVPPEIAAKFLRSNLAYYAAYFDDQTREYVERLYQCEHPVFGAIAVYGPPSTEEAFELGINRGRRKGPQTLVEMRAARL